MQQQKIIGIILGVVTLAALSSSLDRGAIAQAAQVIKDTEVSLPAAIAKDIGGGGPRGVQGSNQDTNNVRGQLNHLYRLILNRAPDDFGMNYYMSRYYNDRWSIEQIRQELFNSEEARNIRDRAINQARNGRNDNSQYNNRDNNRDRIRYEINQIYRRVLNRNADNFGMNYYLESYYNNGWSLERIREHIWSSDEARDLRGW